MCSETPLKAEHVRTSTKQRLYLDDVRPTEFQNIPGYNDYVRNCVINYVAATGDDIAARHGYNRANLQAANVDHAYCQLPLLEYHIDRITALTHQDALKLEKKTRGQSRSSIWHTARQWRLTASNFGRIIKCMSDKSRWRLCEVMANPPVLMTKPVMHGKKYESAAILKFEEVMHMKVHSAGLFVNPDHSYLGASPDGVIDEHAIIEVKCPYTFRHDVVEAGRKFPFIVRDENGALSLKKSHCYYTQVQGQLFITGRQLCYFVVYTFETMVVIPVAYDHDYCYYSLLPKLSLFYSKFYRRHLSTLL